MTTENNPIDPRCLCRCCGWSFGDYFPWGEDGMSPEYAICDCCGCESGNEDHSQESLDEYRQKWFDSGAKWWQSKTKPNDRGDGLRLKDQLERIKPTKCFHQVPGYSPFGSKGFKTPEAAIAAGQTTDARRKEELGLDLGPIKGKVVRKIHWSSTELALEFTSDLYLVLKSEPDRIDAFISNTNIADRDGWFDEYEFVHDEKTSWRWSPIFAARYFTGRVFTGIQLEYRFTWLYFQKCPKLIECIQIAVQESELPVLTWDEGV